MSSRRYIAPYGAAVLAAILVGLAGCGGKELKTYPVRGKVVLADGKVEELAGSHLEFMLESEPTVRADARIEPDGSFAVQMQHQGKLLKGAPEGTYKVRIILAEEDDGRSRGRPGRPVHDRFLDFKTSGLTFPLPPSGDLIVNVSRR